MDHPQSTITARSVTVTTNGYWLGTLDAGSVRNRDNEWLRARLIWKIGSGCNRDNEWLQPRLWSKQHVRSTLNMIRLERQMKSVQKWSRIRIILTPPSRRLPLLQIIPQGIATPPLWGYCHICRSSSGRWGLHLIFWSWDKEFNIVLLWRIAL